MKEENGNIINLFSAELFSSMLFLHLFIWDLDSPEYT